MNVIESTNHLDEDALLEFLLAFLEHPVEFPDIPDLVMHIDVIGSGSEEDAQLFLRCYAGEDDREHWQREFPDYEMPAKQIPPFDRDRYPAHARMRRRRPEVRRCAALTFLTPVTIAGESMDTPAVSVMAR